MSQQMRASPSSGIEEIEREGDYHSVPYLRLLPTFHRVPIFGYFLRQKVRPAMNRKVQTSKRREQGQLMIQQTKSEVD